MPYDIAHDVRYPLWLDPHNSIPLKQHRFLMYALTLIYLASKLRESMPDEKKGIFDNVRNLFDRGIHSCASWWASKRPWYSPDMILRGLNEILMSSVNARRSIPDNLPDIQDAMVLIMEGMLKAQSKIIMSL